MLCLWENTISLDFKGSYRCIGRFSFNQSFSVPAQLCLLQLLQKDTSVNYRKYSNDSRQQKIYLLVIKAQNGH